MKKVLITYMAVMAIIFSVPLFSAKGGEKVNIKNGDDVEISLFDTKKGETVNISLEEYIKGVLPAEVPASFSDEALKAQAVAARTYAYHKYLEFSENPDKIPESHNGAVLCTDSAHCEAYMTKDSLSEVHGQTWIDEYYDKICSAVDETAGEIMVWEDEPILAVFHSSSFGGRTESSKDVWGSDVPYLVSVESGGEANHEGFYSTVTFSDEEFKNITRDELGIELGDDKNTWFGETVKTEGGGVKSMVIGGTAVSGTDIRRAYGLRSTCFYINSMDGEVTFSVEGFGHGVGLSQYGAENMAKNGASYKEILEKYYQGASLSKI